jgi:hypothetical protein
VWGDRNHSGDIGPVTLGESGEYRLEFDGSGATVGDYRFRLVDIGSLGATALGVWDGNLTPRSETDLSAIEGRAGQRLN